MLVETNMDSYSEQIMIDSDLVGKVDDPSVLNNIKVFPNPFSNQINFHINDTENIEVLIQIFDIRGNEIVNMVEVIDNNTDSYISIDTQGGNIDLKPGTYFYKITTSNYTMSGKLIRVN